MEFNLIVVHEAGADNYSWVRNYVHQLLGDRVKYASSYQSVILYRAEDPREAARLIRESATGTPVIKAIPVDYVTDPEVSRVREAVRKLAARIPPNEPFRITLEGRLYRVNEQGFTEELHTIDAIRELAEYVDRPVDLENPRWIIYVRVVRYHRVIKKAAISLLRPEELKRVSY